MIDSRVRQFLYSFHFTAFCFANDRTPIFTMRYFRKKSLIYHFYSALSRTGKKNVVRKIRLFKMWVWSDIALRKISSDPTHSSRGIPGHPPRSGMSKKIKCYPGYRGNCAVFRGPFLTSGMSSRSFLERSITRSCRMVSDILNALTTRNFSLPSIFGCKPEFGTLIAEKFTERLSLFFSFPVKN